MLARRSRSRVRTRDVKCVLECDEDGALSRSRVRAWMQSVPQREVDNVLRAFQGKVCVHVTLEVHLSVIRSMYFRAVLGHVYVHVTWNVFMLAMFLLARRKRRLKRPASSLRALTSTGHYSKVHMTDTDGRRFKKELLTISFAGPGI